MLRKLYISILSVAVCFSLAVAQMKDPSVDAVIEQHVKALGSRAALRAPGMLILKGRLQSTAEEENGQPLEISIADPKVYVRVGDDSLQLGFNGDVVWRHAQSEALQQHKGRQLAELVTVFNPARALSWKEWYPAMSLKQGEAVGDRKVYVLDMGTPNRERLFIDQQSGLLLRDEVMPNVTFTFSDYRAVEGIQVPFKIEQTTASADLKYTYRIESAARVPKMDDTRFDPR